MLAQRGQFFANFYTLTFSIQWEIFPMLSAKWGALNSKLTYFSMPNNLKTWCSNFEFMVHLRMPLQSTQSYF
jgi:hypothetical protein